MQDEATFQGLMALVAFRRGKVVDNSFRPGIIEKPERDFEQTLVYYSLPSVARE